MLKGANQNIFDDKYILHREEKLAQLIALLPCITKVLGANLSLGSFCLKFACSLYECEGF